MRILLLNQFYVPDVAATGQLLADLAAELAALGHEVHVVCSRRAYGGGTLPGPACPSRGGVKVHRLPASGFGRAGLTGRLADYLSFYVLAAARVLSLRRMDVCVALTTPPLAGLIGAALKRWRGTRLVLWTMDLYPQVAVAYGTVRRGGAVHRLLGALAARLCAAADGIICPGETMRSALVAAGADGGKVLAADNWVPGEVVQPMSAALSAFRGRRCRSGGPIVMYCGNLGLGHDLDVVIRAWAALGAAAPGELVFVGEGSMLAALKSLARELGLRSTSFHPPVPLARLSDCLAAGDIHLVSQRQGAEGLIVPSKLYGVLAAGRPVIFMGPRGSEAARIVASSGAGLIVPPGDATALADAIRTLSADAELRAEMGRRGEGFYHANLGRRRSLHRIVSVVLGLHPTPPQPEESPSP